MYVVYDDRYGSFIKFSNHLDENKISKPWIKVFTLENVTPENLREFLQTKQLEVDEQGNLIIKDREDVRREIDYKKEVKKEIKEMLTLLIGFCYPSKHQAEEIKDFDFWKFVVAQQLNLDEKSIREKIYNSAIKVISGESTLKAEIDSFCYDESNNPIVIHYLDDDFELKYIWKKLIKIAIKQIWLQKSKMKADKMIEEIENKSEEEIKKMFYQLKVLRANIFSFLRNADFFAGFSFATIFMMNKGEG